MADKDYEFATLTSFLSSDFTGFRVKEVSSSVKAAPIEANEREAAMYNVGILTLSLSSTTLWRDLLHRAELARRLEICGTVSADQKLLTMAENAAPRFHVIRGLIKLRQMGRAKQPISSTSVVRVAKSEIVKASQEAQSIARKHLGEHHPILIQIQQEEFQQLQKLYDRLKIGSTSKGNPGKEILNESLICRQAALATSVRVLGRSHIVTKSLVESIGVLHQSLENFDGAIASFQEALKITNRSGSALERVKLILKIAKCFQQKGEIDNAISQVQEARKILEEREKDGAMSSDESRTFDSCYYLTAQLAMTVISNGADPSTVNLFDEQQQFSSSDFQSYVSLAFESYEILYERVRSNPDRLQDGENLIQMLRKIVALRLCLCRPSQQTLIKAARRLPTTQQDQSKARDMLLRMATVSSSTLYSDRILEAAEQNPTSAGLEELRLLIVVATYNQAL
jgi:tetratricopeptide (TPR) repeat protein